MSEQLHWFRTSESRAAVSLPFSLSALIDDWTALRHRMIREVAPGFTRDEWAYLIAFLDPDALRRPFLESFGIPADEDTSGAFTGHRPRTPVAIWLPANVSLLGPLTLILVGLTGAKVHLKGASSAESLTAEFVNFAMDRLDEGPLSRWLGECAQFEFFDRNDPRNAEMAAEAAVRVVFGTRDTAASVDALPHPPGSLAIHFTDRVSEAWVDSKSLDAPTLDALCRVFAVYGRAGCTSPRRVVVLDSDEAGATAVRDRLVERFSAAVKQGPEQNAASEAVLARQWATALGWDALTAGTQAAVIGAGASDLTVPDGDVFLPVVGMSVDQAVESLPENIQTIGYALEASRRNALASRLIDAGVKRLVPIPAMHFFGHQWDGYSWWRTLFEDLEVS